MDDQLYRGMQVVLLVLRVVLRGASSCNGVAVGHWGGGGFWVLGVLI